MYLHLLLKLRFPLFVIINSLFTCFKWVFWKLRFTIFIPTFCDRKTLSFHSLLFISVFHFFSWLHSHCQIRGEKHFENSLFTRFSNYHIQLFLVNFVNLSLMFFTSISAVTIFSTSSKDTFQSFPFISKFAQFHSVSSISVFFLFRFSFDTAKIIASSGAIVNHEQI